MREVDFTKKRLQQEFEDKLEVEQQNKRQLERRVRLGRSRGLCLRGPGGELVPCVRPVKAGGRQAWPGTDQGGWHVSFSVQGQSGAGYH